MERMCAVYELDATSGQCYMVCLIGHTEFGKKKKKVTRAEVILSP